MTHEEGKVGFSVLSSQGQHQRQSSNFNSDKGQGRSSEVEEVKAAHTAQLSGVKFEESVLETQLEFISSAAFPTVTSQMS